MSFQLVIALDDRSCCCICVFAVRSPRSLNLRRCDQAHRRLAFSCARRPAWRSALPRPPPVCSGSVWGIVEESALTGASTLLRCGCPHRSQKLALLSPERLLRSTQFRRIAATLCLVLHCSHRPLASAVASHPCCEADRAVRPFIIQPPSCSPVAAIFSAVSPFLIVFSAFLPRRLLLLPLRCVHPLLTCTSRSQVASWLKLAKHRAAKSRYLRSPPRPAAGFSRRRILRPSPCCAI